MILKRKIEKQLEDWLSMEGHKPALICGVRQCGKTFSILEFAKEHFKNVIVINFMEEPQYKDIFVNSLNIDDIIFKLKVQNNNFVFEPKKTIIFFDEIQECPRARLSLKAFYNDGRFEVIASGSYLGINGYYAKDATPIPVGYEHILNMKTMDFEEFLWANGYDASTINFFEKSLKEHKAVDLSIHNTMMECFKKYMVIGGYPDVVTTYLSTKDVVKCREKIKSIMLNIESDFGRRLNKDGRPIFKPNEVAIIREAFNMIPTYLAKENKRYIVSKIPGITNLQAKKDAITYLEETGIIFRVHNVENLSTPLEFNKIQNSYKVFVSDISIIMAMIKNDNIIAEILLGQNSGQSYGYLFEAAVAEQLYKNDKGLFYFAKEGGLELDFVVQLSSVASIIEVKARTGNAKSAKTVLAHPDHYGKANLIKIGDYNVGYENGILTIPYYLTFLLNRIN